MSNKVKYDEESNTVIVEYANGVIVNFCPVNAEVYQAMIGSESVLAQLHKFARENNLVGTRRGLQ